MNSKKAEMLMVSVSFVWGSSYLLMKIGLGNIAPFNLIALRFGIDVYKRQAVPFSPHLVRKCPSK